MRINRNKFINIFQFKRVTEEKDVDWDIIISTTVSLTSDMYYNTLTIISWWAGWDWLIFVLQYKTTATLWTITYNRWAWWAWVNWWATWAAWNIWLTIQIAF